MNKKKLLNCQHAYTYSAPHLNLEMTIYPSIRSSQKRSNLENGIHFSSRAKHNSLEGLTILALIVHVFVSGVTLLQETYKHLGMFAFDWLKVHLNELKCIRALSFLEFQVWTIPCTGMTRDTPGRKGGSKQTHKEMSSATLGSKTLQELSG